MTALLGLGLGACVGQKEHKAAPAPTAAPGPASATGATGTASATGASTGTAAAPSGDCVKIWSDDVESLRLVSKAAAVGSDIDQRLEFGTGRVAGSGYKMTEATLEPVQVEYQATPEQVETVQAALRELCVPPAKSTGEAPKGFVRYGVVTADGAERWMAAEGMAAGLPADAEFFALPKADFIAVNKAWPRAAP